MSIYLSAFYITLFSSIKAIRINNDLLCMILPLFIHFDLIFEQKYHTVIVLEIGIQLT